MCLAGSNTLYTHDIELTFKRYIISSIMRPPNTVVFLLYGKEVFAMDIFVYSNESGVFDKIHNNYFVISQP